jgi:hypothetical protein
MKISRPEILQENNDTVYRVRVETSKGTTTLWYTMGKQFGDLVTDFCDSPLVALLIPAMATGEDIQVAGTISERLYHNLSGPYQRLLQHVIPSLRRIKLYPADIQSGGRRASGVATGFSGGIDSYCVLADHFYSNVPMGFKVTHLLFNNVGSHGMGGERLFKERYTRLAPIVERIGLPFVRINSNVDAFYRKIFTFQQTHTTRNASAALLLQNGIGRYFYASAFSYTDVFVGAASAMGHSDPIALPLLSTDALDAYSVGSEYTRVEKTLRVAGIPDSHGTLDVCVDFGKAGNCSACWKCMRTLLTLDIAGLLDCYSASFDLDAYERRRCEYIASVLRSHDPLLREIVEFARERRYLFPISSRLRSWMDYPASWVKPVAKLSIRASRKLKIVLHGAIRKAFKWE